MFRNTDKKLEELGFVKTYESNTILEYERYNNKYDFTHVLSFIHKKSGNHMFISFEKGLNKDCFNNAVGLTKKELKLCYKKLKELWG